MKKFGIIIALIVGMMIGTAQAVTINGFDVSGNVTATTDYVFRGVSQNNENGVIQATVDVEYNGFYGAVFGSPVKLGDTGANFEVDGAVGYRNTAYNWFQYDVGTVGYWYPDSDSDLDYYEFYGKVGTNIDVVSVYAGLNYSPDYFDNAGSNYYWSAGASITPIWDVTFAANVGYSDLADADNVDNVTDWSVSAAKVFANTFEVKVAYYDTDASDFDFDKLFDNRFVLSGSILF